MKKTILLLLTTVLLAGSLAAQQQTTLKELTGTWNLFSMDVPGEMYFNTRTDSIYIKPQQDEDSAMTAFKNSMMKNALKSEFAKMNFVMDAAGNMYEGMNTNDSSKRMGQYNEEKGVLLVNDKESSEIHEIQLSLKENILTMITTDKGIKVTMLCIKRP